MSSLPHSRNFSHYERKTQSEQAITRHNANGPIGAAPQPPPAWQSTKHKTLRRNPQQKWIPKLDDPNTECSDFACQADESTKERSNETKEFPFLAKQGDAHCDAEKQGASFSPSVLEHSCEQLKTELRAEQPKTKLQRARPEMLHSAVSSRSTSPGCASSSEHNASPLSACADTPIDFFRLEPMYVPVTSAWMLDGRYHDDLNFSGDPVMISMPGLTWC